MVGAIVLSPIDAASEEVSLAEPVMVPRVRGPPDAAVNICLEYFDSYHPEFKLERSARSVVQVKGVLPQAVPCVANAPVDLHEEVGVMIDDPPEVHELVRLVIHLAVCLYSEYGGRIRQPLPTLT